MRTRHEAGLEIAGRVQGVGGSRGLKNSAKGVSYGMTLERFFPDTEDSLLAVIDIQDRLASVMQRKDEVVKNCLHLIELATMKNIPVVVTEQYPKGLGRTVAEIQAALPAYRPVEKNAFNCCDEPSFLRELRSSGRRKVFLTGMETHICVLQTCIGLLKKGFTTHVVQDAVCSRTQENWSVGLGFMRDAGAVITCTETVLFQLLRVAGTEEFKKISQRIK